MTHFKHISIDASKTMIDEQTVSLVDIRDAASFALGHIETATLIDNENVQDYIRGADLDQPLIVYCYHGNASQSAAQFFIEQGFDDVYSLDGGFESWKQIYPYVT